jgi:proteasome lid subunit RPN8/RPN11
VKRLTNGVLERAFEHLRRCGDGARECVVYLTGPVDQPSVIDGVVHPHHTSSAVGYDLDSAAIADLWRDLATAGRSIRVQVHTHPGPAYHSSRDDALAIVHTRGFLSLVIPQFATGPIGLTEAFLAARDEDGHWVEVPINEHLEATDGV